MTTLGYRLYKAYMGLTVVIRPQWGFREGESVTMLVQNRVMDLQEEWTSFLNEAMDYLEMVRVLELSGVWRRSFIQTPQLTHPPRKLEWECM